MTKTVERKIVKTIQRKRHTLEEMREEIDDLIDYLNILEARARDDGKPRLGHAEVKRRFGVR